MWYAIDKRTNKSKQDYDLVALIENLLENEGIEEIDNKLINWINERYENKMIEIPVCGFRSLGNVTVIAAKYYNDYDALVWSFCDECADAVLYKIETLGEPSVTIFGNYIITLA